MKKIIVAGGGHGGYAVAANLARVGYDVTVYEKNPRDKMGHDWTDIFAPASLAVAGIPFPAEDKYEYKCNMTFYSPNEKTPILQQVPEDQLEIKMERRDIYDLLISTAEKNGAKLVFGCEVLAPIMAGSRVIGIKTTDGDIFGDLIIDACGIYSPIRTQLPSACLIENNTDKMEQIYIYRAFYNKLCEGDPVNKFNVFLLPQGKLGINWVAEEEEYVDVLIGRFSPLDEAEVESSLEYLRANYPMLGTEIKRGGQFVPIPVRHTLSVLVCDGYAAIGDSAFMTVPLIGSGIANTLKASKILADTIIADIDGSYTAESLWGYQKKYYAQLGSGLAPVACIKNALTVFTPEEVDYLFEAKVLTADDLTIGADSTSLTDFLKGGSMQSVVDKVVGIVKDKAILKKLMPVIGKVVAGLAVCGSMPKNYDRLAVKTWAKKYNKIYKV